MSLGSVSLGYAYEPVLAAVRTQLDLGAAFPRPAAIEMEFAREFLSEMPGADRVKFAKNGSSITTAAVKLARASTGRDLVAFPKNHPFYSFDDWFIGTTPCSGGVPQAVANLSLTYDSNQPDTLRRLFRDHPGKIACVISEPCDLVPASPDLLREVVQIAHSSDAVFIADEMLSGYRAGWPGACQRFGITPDLTTWGKAIGNGFSFCALTGKAEIMDLGGIQQRTAPRVFLISTTHGGEAHAIAAARAVLHAYKTLDVLGHQQRIVFSVAAGLKKAILESQLGDYVTVHVSEWRLFVACKDERGNDSLPFRTLLIQEMIRRGVLFQGAFFPCYSHTAQDVEQIVDAFTQSCAIYRSALTQGVSQFLIGDPIRPVFRKYNGCNTACAQDPCPLEFRCRAQTEITLH
jgi:glutamate-1-semialdehyde aminotransferase